MTKNMRDSFENMTLEELWKLFPITLSDHNPKWKEWAECEVEHLRVILEIFSPRITHIGSTAIPGIKAKPIVDVLVEISDDCEMPVIRGVLEESGYICMSSSDNRMSFNKGYTTGGYAEKVFHIHIHRIGDNDEILFRDYLVSHGDIAKEYEALKLALISIYGKNRDAYTDAKSEFVKRVVMLGNDGSAK